MTKNELNKYKTLLEAKQAELAGGLRNREGIAIEKTADALDEAGLHREAGVLPNFGAVPDRAEMIRRGPGGKCEEKDQVLAHSLLSTSGDRFRPHRMTAALRLR